MPIVVGQSSRGQRKRRGPGRPRIRSYSAPASLTCTKNTKKRKQWSNESMSKAIEAVRQVSSNILRDAVTHGIPRQTLQD